MKTARLLNPLQETSEEESESESESDPEAEDEIKPNLVRNIRLDDGLSSAGILAKDWDFTVQDTTEYRDDLRAATGIGRRRKKHGRSGPALSFHTKTLIGAGNQAYVDGDVPGAIRLMLEVIRIEPRASAAWAVLAQCYDEQKEPAKALQLRIMGAHLKQDAEEWDRLARQSKELGYPQQALYCWKKGHRIDRSNVAALWDCAMLAKELGDLRTTRTAFLGILAQFPHDLHILSELQPILVELGDLQKGAALFQDAFDHHRSTFTASVACAASSASFGLLEILVLADLYCELGEHGRAVDAVRKGARWLQGRAHEAHWDLCEDDREFDGPDGPAARVCDAVNGVSTGNNALDVNARHRLAIARIKMGELEEGKMHTEKILAEDVVDYAPLFTELADAYFDIEMFAEARAIYEKLGCNGMASSVHVLSQTAICMRKMNDLQDAAEVYEIVRKVDPENNDAKMKLAELYEIMNEPRRALELVYEVLDSRRRRPKDPNAAQAGAGEQGTPSLIQDKRVKGRPTQKSTNRLSNVELREMEAKKEAEVMEGYRRVKQLWPHMLQGEGEARQEWLVEASKLIEAFRETRKLFATSRVFRGMFPTRRVDFKVEEGDEDRMLCRLQMDLAHETTARKTRSGDKYNRVDVFRGVGFDDWLRLFIQYAFITTERGDYDQADEILRHLLMSAAYSSAPSQDCIRVALMTCAAAAGQFQGVVEQSRKLHYTHQFHNEPLRMMMAALGSGLRATDAFLDTTFQKYLHREMLLLDAAAHRPESVMWSPSHKRFSLTAACGREAPDSGDEDLEDHEVTSMTGDGGRRKRPCLPENAKTANPIVVAIYGQMCLIAKSYQSAIFYLLMAYDYCPEDPMISLCITIASLGRAAQRQCDNRHHLVTQAMAFLARYREYRGAVGVGDHHRSEIEYNVGRTFHQLGLFSHAAHHYERAIDAADSTDPQCAREAAYNLSVIYIGTGARHLAVALYRRWLSI
ncbi:hypothetical protein GGX14DRAFT_552972 [Mycena pura]|uniref:TPR-like protein n=1 Tax=Mycena pura TaxID=153505 RepID=A0AAD6UQN7_9AGAR|nr:hypothetical protein GGX14DRAFT_552972 [Mycena pura]